MKHFIFTFVALLSANAFASSSTPVPLIKQNFVSVEYTSNGKQSGCGLRATAENKDNLTLNALITVFMKDTGATFGVVKVVARKAEMKNGVPKMKNGSPVFLNIGNVTKAWFKPDSAAQPKVYSQGTSHNDGYMETVDYASTVDLMQLLSQENFKIGFSFNTGQADQTFIFDQWMDRREGNAFAACMANLNNVIEENKKKRSF
ncbi:MAG: hypothetical protein HOO95_00300 [Gallionella sp.]|nr:hypothetical protein [Gallionella sp.]